jgi:NAD-dependent SIR2 family protein deacetylase
MMEMMAKAEVYYCDKPSCEGKNRPIKPDVVFFGESLPTEFHEAVNQIAENVDLCLVMGTSLAVAPFNRLTSIVKKDVPKVLFNLNNTKETGGIDFEEKNRMKLFVKGKCDETLAKLAEDCGWKEDFENTLPDYHKNK